MNGKKRLLISACFLGQNCKYNGGHNSIPAVKALQERFECVPICPECLGKLPIPREPSERAGNRVVSRSGMDVTAAFQKGAEECWQIAQKEGCRLALLKERSPSCGFGMIYDGSFTGTVIPGNGVTAELLYKNGVAIYGESQIDKLLQS